ncbi:MAG TPA: hypothetical protein VIW29_03725 [Polyangiaceae bacterium]
MKVILSVVMGLALAVAGCSSSECEDAADKFDECGIAGDDKPSDEDVEECSEQGECGAKCVNAASCEELKAFFNDLTLNNVATCLSACQ